MLVICLLMQRKWKSSAYLTSQDGASCLLPVSSVYYLGRIPSSILTKKLKEAPKTEGWKVLLHPYKDNQLYYPKMNNLRNLIDSLLIFLYWTMQTIALTLRTWLFRAGQFQRGDPMISDGIQYFNLMAMTRRKSPVLLIFAYRTS